jgi:hypothetical protein
MPRQEPQNAIPSRHGSVHELSADVLMNEASDVINRSLLFQIQELKLQYHRSGNPPIVYERGNQLANLFRGVPDYRLYQLGCLHQFLGYLLITANRNLASIQLAEAHIRLALSIFDAHAVTTTDVLADLTRGHWLLGICLKMQSKHDESVDILSRSLSDPYLRRMGSPGHRIPLIRQLVIMAQAHQSFQRLSGTLRSQMTSPVEYFHSVRRLFEFSLNSHDLRAARVFFDECSSAFAKAKPLLESVHIAAYYKSVFHFFRMSNQDILADMVLKNTVRTTNRLGLHGQKRQLLSLAEQFHSKRVVDVKSDVASYNHEE